MLKRNFFIFNTMKASELLSQIEAGETRFAGLHIAGSLAGANLEGIIFDQCSFLVDFTGANLKGTKFLKGNIKRANFTDADLTKAFFEYMTIDAAIFRGAKASDVYFRENTYAGEYVSQDQFDQRLRYAADY
jgi:uncharacterized protein YjbI with pentapeptide repeats